MLSKHFKKKSFITIYNYELNRIYFEETNNDYVLIYFNNHVILSKK